MATEYAECVIELHPDEGHVRLGARQRYIITPVTNGFRDEQRAFEVRTKDPDRAARRRGFKDHDE